jgi:hypothetical protein
VSRAAAVADLMHRMDCTEEQANALLDDLIGDVDEGPKPRQQPARKPHPPDRQRA